MKLHLIRHGQTTSSGKTYAGRADVALTAEGRAMARQLADRLSAQPISVILASPLRRAIDTATPLARALGLGIQTDPLLIEFDFGVYEGQPKAAFDIALRKAHARAPVEGGEALIDVWNRAGRFIDKLRDMDGKEIAVVGHFWTNRMIYGHFNGWDFETSCRSREYRPKTGSLTTVSRARHLRGVENTASKRR